MPYAKKTLDSEVEAEVSASRRELEKRIEEVCNLLDTRAQAAKCAGVSVEQLANYIQGRSKPGFLALKGICEEAGASLDWLSTGEGEMLIKNRHDNILIDDSLLGDAISAVEEHLAVNKLILEPEKKALLILELVMITIEDGEGDKARITGKLARLVRLAT